jgi:hypothetical protein
MPLLRHLLSLAVIAVFLASASAAVEDPAVQALSDAQSLARAGEFEAALERHQWYHANALRINQAQYGVRLSFALSSWKSLGEKYPPALAALTALRDQGTQTVLDGKAPPELFHDVVSINRTLKEEDQSVKLFKTLAESQPDLAKRVLRFMEDALIAAGEVALFVRFSGDSAAFLQRKIKEHQHLMAIIQKGPGPPQSQQHFENRLVALTLSLSEHAASQGDPNLAAHLREMTAEVIHDPRLTE